MNRWARLGFFIGAGVLTLFATWFLTRGPTSPVTWPTQEWAHRTPETVGVDPARLADFLAEVREKNIPLHTLVVVRHGAVCLEAVWHPYSAEIRHSVESNTKAVVGALMGIAIAQGKIAGVEVGLPGLFPGRLMKDEEKKRHVTVRNLLTMTSGLDADFTPGGSALWSAPSWTQYLLDRPLSNPESGWAYRSGDAHLLAAGLREATGVDARVWANRYLFGPLGIAEVRPEEWATDPEGLASGIAGLRLTPRELAKFGLLYLQRGRWDGRQMVPEDWVRQSTQVQVDLGHDPFVGGQHRGWGYLWSVFPDEGYYGYLGRGGQNLVISESRDLVVVMTAGLPPGQEGSLLSLVNRHLLPACAPGPLAPMKEVHARLASELAQLLPPVGTATIPQVWRRASNRTWTMEANPLGWSQLTVSFAPDSTSAQVVLPPGTWNVGLDGRYRLNPVRPGQTLALRGWFDANSWHLEQVELESFPRVNADLRLDGLSLTALVTDASSGTKLATMRGVPRP